MSSETMIHASRPWSGAPSNSPKGHIPKIESIMVKDWSFRCLDCPFPVRPTFCRPYLTKAPEECPLDGISK